MAGRADLARQNEVERRVEGAGGGRGDRNAATGQGVNDGISRRTAQKGAGQNAAGGLAIREPDRSGPQMEVEPARRRRNGLLQRARLLE